MDKLQLQSILFGVLSSLIIVFLECRRVASSHYEHYGKNELFNVHCGTNASHIAWLTIVFFFWFGLSSVSYGIFWFKYLPLW